MDTHEEFFDIEPFSPRRIAASSSAPDEGGLVVPAGSPARRDRLAAERRTEPPRAKRLRRRSEELRAVPSWHPNMYDVTVQARAAGFVAPTFVHQDVWQRCVAWVGRRRRWSWEQPEERLQFLLRNVWHAAVHSDADTIRFGHRYAVSNRSTRRLERVDLMVEARTGHSGPRVCIFIAP